MWDIVASTIAQEFGDIAEPRQITQVVVRMFMAALLGGLIGLERELRGKSAGIRTHMLVSLGCALFILIPLQAGMDEEALSRVMQGLLAGIGFLCAGSILKSMDDDQIYGLTTAAGLWMTAAIGMAAGLGREGTAALATGLALLILALEEPLRRLRRATSESGRGIEAGRQEDR